MGKPIQEIEGIGPAGAEKLGAAGIKSTTELLERGGTRRGRKQIAEASGFSESRILRWVNMVDLFRIEGIGGEFAELLESSGVDTVKELGARKAEHLAVTLAEVNERQKLTRRVLGVAVVTGWVEQARQLPPKVEH
jgi:predicted flap endonuclease-1-like 5' DNA nuclease